MKKRGIKKSNDDSFQRIVGQGCNLSFDKNNSCDNLGKSVFTKRVLLYASLLVCFELGHSSGNIRKFPLLYIHVSETIRIGKALADFGRESKREARAGCTLSGVRQVAKPTKFIALTKPARFRD